MEEFLNDLLVFSCCFLVFSVLFLFLSPVLGALLALLATLRDIADFAVDKYYEIKGRREGRSCCEIHLDRREREERRKQRLFSDY